MTDSDKTQAIWNVVTANAQPYRRHVVVADFVHDIEEQLAQRGYHVVSFAPDHPNHPEKQRRRALAAAKEDTP